MISSVCKRIVPQHKNVFLIFFFLNLSTQLNRIIGNGDVDLKVNKSSENQRKACVYTSQNWWLFGKRFGKKIFYFQIKNFNIKKICAISDFGYAKDEAYEAVCEF